jgi:hypothetical protein
VDEHTQSIIQELEIKGRFNFEKNFFIYYRKSRSGAFHARSLEFRTARTAPMNELIKWTN